jgi:hypothetical protein
MNLPLVARDHSRHNTGCQSPKRSVLADPNTCGFSQTKQRPDMLRLTKAAAAFGLITLGIQGFGLNVRGQAIAYMPIPGQALTGSTLGVTPVVSADRRYVRLTVNPSFNVLNGFSTFGIPGAVSGGPSVNAGMNGVIGPVGVDDGSGINPYGFVGSVGEMRAGPLPLNGGPGAGNSRAQSDLVMQGPGSMMNGWPDGQFDQSQMWPLDVPNRSGASGGQRGKSSAKTVSRQRRAGRKAATQPKTTSPSVRSAR